MSPSDVDSRLRLAAFRWLEEQVEMLPWSLLLHGFTFEGTRTQPAGDLQVEGPHSA